jgi:hypothetical protein
MIMNTKNASLKHYSKYNILLMSKSLLSKNENTHIAIQFSGWRLSQDLSD